MFAGCSGNNAKTASPRQKVLAAACRYLWGKQSPDGGWHSETYGILKSGQAWTPFVLFALIDIPDSIVERPVGGVDRGLSFIRSHVNADGAIGLADPDVLEYPNYATAYALRVLIRSGRVEDPPLVARMTQYLAGQQCTAVRGYTPDALVFGGWGFGETELPEGSPGYVDLSHTRRVLQALREAGHQDSAAFAASQVFLRLLQKDSAETRLQPGVESKHDVRYDGGFYYSPVVLARNKGGRSVDSSGHDAYYRSYATATCDGALALVASGIPASDHRVADALGWLKQHAALDHAEGIPVDSEEQWGRVMFFYHLLVRSEVYSGFNWQGEWKEEMIALLAARQNEDGSFSNPYGELNKEDDPILATAMAVMILTNVGKLTQ